MITLKGKISVQRLSGILNIIASEGAGGPLQSKVIFPKHDEQIVVPGDDYYGLAVVTVRPTPRLPFCATSMQEGTADIWYGEGAYITALNGVELSVTAEVVTEEVME